MRRGDTEDVLELEKANVEGCATCKARQDWVEEKSDDLWIGKGAGREGEEEILGYIMTFSPFHPSSSLTLLIRNMPHNKKIIST